MCKKAISAVVKNISEMFHAKGLQLDASGLTDKAGKRQYERNNIYVRPSKKRVPMVPIVIMYH